MFRDLSNMDSPVRRAAIARYLSAFACVGGLVFLGLCLLWPLSVEHFRSQAAIHVQPHEVASLPSLSTEDAFAVFVRCVQMESTPEQVGAIINEVAESTPVRARPLDYRNFESIQQSIKLGVEPGDGGTLNFILGYDGLGYPDEQVFLTYLSQRVAHRLQQVQTNDDGKLTFMVPQEKLEQAIALANQIENGAAPNSPSGSSFRLASTRKVANGSTITDDSRALSEVLAELKQQASGTQSHSLIQLDHVSEVSTWAEGGQPGWTAIVLIGLSSIGIGGFVAWHLDPFVGRGFESNQHIERMLEVPVVATVKTSGSGNETRISWANRTVEISATILLAFLVAIIGFLVIDPTIRTSFSHNPFEGLTRIVQIFMGF